MAWSPPVDWKCWMDGCHYGTLVADGCHGDHRVRPMDATAANTPLDIVFTGG